MRNLIVRRTFTLCALVAFTLCLEHPASGSVLTFSGIDPSANSTDPRPNSNNAAAAFDTAAGALGAVGVIDFESAPLGAFSSLTVASGVSLSGNDFLANNQTVRNVAVHQPDRLFGYNTTVGGSQFVYVNAGTLTFTFSSPTSAFGAYFTGVQVDGETLTFNDGTAQTLSIPNPGAALGGAEFFGFTDAGHSFSSVTINAQNDFIGVDDVRFVSSATPEPATLAPFGLSLLAGAMLLLRRIRRA